MNGFKSAGRWRAGLVAILITASLGGCALATDDVTLGYEPDKSPPSINGASNAKVAVAITDNRPEPKNKISFKINALGMPMAPILALNDPAQLIAQAVRSELQSRGFQIGSGGSDVTIELANFFSTFKNGFFSGSADAVVFITVIVKSADGSVAYNRAITGHKLLTDVQLASGSNTKLALDAAAKDAVGQLMADAQFIAALLKTGSPAGKPTAGVATRPSLVGS